MGLSVPWVCGAHAPSSLVCFTSLQSKLHLSSLSDLTSQASSYRLKATHTRHACTLNPHQPQISHPPGGEGMGNPPPDHTAPAGNTFPLFGHTDSSTSVRFRDRRFCFDTRPNYRFTRPVGINNCQKERREKMIDGEKAWVHTLFLFLGAATRTAACFGDVGSFAAAALFSFRCPRRFPVVLRQRGLRAPSLSSGGPRGPSPWCWGLMV